jgi:hypothetical protein
MGSSSHVQIVLRRANHTASNHVRNMIRESTRKLSSQYGVGTLLYSKTPERNNTTKPQQLVLECISLIAAGGHALLVVAGGLVVGVDDGVGGHAVGVVGLGPGVDGVDVVEHSHGEKGEHGCTNSTKMSTKA